MAKIYNFDEPIQRQGTDCVKYDMLKSLYGSDDLMPMWVADMDFRSPDFVIDAMRRRLDHEVLGYALASDNYYETVCHWLTRHYGINAVREDLHFIPGIVAGIAFALQSFTVPGDKVLVTTPVYPPFLNLPRDSGRELECSPLIRKDGRFTIDFDDFEQRAKDCKMFILSNPHNPGGTVWSGDDLRRIAAICYRYGLIVVSDEIHADLTLPGHKHISFSTVSDEARRCSLTFMAPSKTFNIAGLSSSMCYVGNVEVRSRFYHWLDGFGVAGGNIFAFVSAEAAFSEGEEWLRQLLNYLKGNVEAVRLLFARRLPKLEVVYPEASFLVWMDFSAYGIDHDELRRLWIDEVHVALNDGVTFGGPSYKCCFRMNIGCPRAQLLDVANRIAAVIEKS